MILNRYEESKISNRNLPEEWKSQSALDELEIFLQQNWEQRSVFYTEKNVTSKQQFLDFIAHQGIRTKNYIGTIVFRGEQLNIYPKMFRPYSDDDEDDGKNELTQKHLMSNLVKWLDYCNRVEYPFISISSELEDTEDLKELFITLYIRYVQSALERGLYYQYVEETEDISSIKGKFDLKDYLIRKIPNGQGNRFRCTYSNFEFDNKVNRIIKFTCKQLMNSTTEKNQRLIRNILMKMNDVEDVKCVPSDCDSIRLSKMQGFYHVIISMSKMFLLNQMSNYSMDMNDSFCFLFPTELLFEGFIGGFIKDVVQEHGGKVYLQRSDMKLVDSIEYAGKSYGGAFTMRLDILAEIKGKVFILDTKYKNYSRFEDNPDEINKIVNEETHQGDVYQVCEYARKRGASEVFLLYPMYRYEEKELTFPTGKSRGPDGDINIHFIRLPFIFEEDEQKTKEQLKVVIETIFDL